MYKPSTLVRRVERRMAVHGLDTMAAYETFLRNNPEEFDLLFKEMLIGVTGFFRDPAAWRGSPGRPHPNCWRQSGARADGCAPGSSGAPPAKRRTRWRWCSRRPSTRCRRRDSCTVQIFATDLSVDAIAMARKGLYPAPHCRSDVARSASPASSMPKVMDFA